MLAVTVSKVGIPDSVKLHVFAAGALGVHFKTFPGLFMQSELLKCGTRRVYIILSTKADLPKTLCNESCI